MTINGKFTRTTMTAYDRIRAQRRRAYLIVRIVAGVIGTIVGLGVVGFMLQEAGLGLVELCFEAAVGIAVGMMIVKGADWLLDQAIRRQAAYIVKSSFGKRPQP